RSTSEAADAKALFFESVEPRVLYSAVPLETTPTGGSDPEDSKPAVQDVAPAQEAVPSSGESSTPLIQEGEANESMDSSLPVPPDATDRSTEDALIQEINASAAPNGVSERQEIVFISADVYDHDYLASQLDPRMEVILIDISSDGVNQMATALQGRSGIDAIHLITHGSAGELYLGDVVLDAANMSGEYADELAMIGAALSSDGDFLIYGCEFAAGDTGTAAAGLIAALTGADVAASTDDTGATALGGDWDLEYRTGNLDSDALSMPGYGALLAPPVWSISGSASVTEGSSASYTLSLAGSIMSGTTASVNLALTDLTTTSGDHANFVTAVNSAIASRPELSFDGTTLTYSPPISYTPSSLLSGSNYTDISGTGTPVSMTDDSNWLWTFGSGATFNFYGGTYTQLYVGSNGFVTFGGGSNDYTNEDLTGGNTLDNLPAIMPLWDDWNPGATSGNEVFVQMTGTAGNHQYIVQWSNIVHYNASQTASFQMVLSESDGSIEFRYQDVDVETAYDFGSSATIGISNGSTQYSQFSFETTSLTNNSRIVYTRAATMAPLTISLGTVNDTTPEPSETFRISLSSPSNSTLGTPQANTTILDNDPAAPVGVDDHYTAGENDASAVLGNALSNDTDANLDSLSATPASGGGSAGGLFSIATNGQVTFDPNGDFEDLAVGESRDTVFTYTVNDGNGGSDTAEITVTVQGANDAPTADSASITVDEESEDTPLGLSAPSDIDGDSLTIIVTALPSVGSVTLADGSPVTNGMSLSAAQLTGLQFDAPAELASAVSTAFTYSVSDGTAPAVTGTVAITINPINDSPVAVGTISNQTSDDADTVAGFDITGFFSDPDTGDSLEYSATGLPAGLSIDLNTGVISGTVDPSASVGGPLSDGVYTVVITADDGNGGTVTQSFTWTVSNPAPTAVNDTGAVDE
ncbi:MAG: DUF4347 domain-containing protein, partial [Verrucomicrobiae bacterium]|nr:DUF4347 domain-containing protein [Verrucomicrobiae bacterium]